MLYILVDMDDVLADYGGAFLRIWRQRFPERLWVPAEQRRFYNHHEEYPEYAQDVRKITSEKGFFLGLEPIDGGIEAVKKFISDGHKVRICTRPTTIFSHCVSEKYDWVEKYMGKECKNIIIPTDDKTWVKGDILIDDHPKIVGEYTPTWEHIVYDKPYNQNTPGRRLTWKNYAEVIKEVMEDKKKKGSG